MSPLDSPSQDSSGQDFSGQDSSSQDFSGQNSSGQDFSGQDFSSQDFSGQNSLGQNSPASVALETAALLKLLQLASPALPVGSYTYSEGLETLVQQNQLTTPEQVLHWLTQELTCGSIQLDAAIMLRSYRAAMDQDWPALTAWNHWLSAARDTAELRAQSWQMGRSLLRLVTQLQPDLAHTLSTHNLAQPDTPWNFAVAFGLAAAHWHIPESSALLGYLQSWATTLVNAAVKLVPLGQTVGQQLLLSLVPALEQAATVIAALPDADLANSGWGLALASMQHETLYSRLFRS